MAVLSSTLENAVDRLCATVDERGAFCGELSSSALSTATASMALVMSEEPDDAALAAKGHAWLCENQNTDGGWGDTIDSPTNISTTLLCWASLATTEHHDTIHRAEAWLTNDAGGELTPERIAKTIRERYGKDQTFSVPILTTCAIAGRLGDDGWELVPSLPYELAAMPHAFFHLLKLTTVSYALPALIAIGQVRQYHHPTGNPFAGMARLLTRGITLRKLTNIQPTSGGFLEAAPLTSFVVMGLLSMRKFSHPVVYRGLEFLRSTVRKDGSWPIDTNLDTWTTTLAVNALGRGSETTLAWIREQQYREVHPYTKAAPGGWAWTDLTGGVPDADDTAGALLALRKLAPDGIDAATAGVRWLWQLRNRDGGVPTFCRGWGQLPFDQSSPDITAHALRAWHTWHDDMPERLQREIGRATCDAVDYLLGEQRGDGSFIPLWFGNQQTKNQENPVYGTSRVVLAAAEVPCSHGLDGRWIDAGHRGVQWLLDAQRDDGGYGSIEETALALEALATWGTAAREDPPAELHTAVERAVTWLTEATGDGTKFPATPIGLYFAKLWYSERLYPLVFTVAALQRASAFLSPS